MQAIKQQIKPHALHSLQIVILVISIFLAFSPLPVSADSITISPEMTSYTGVIGESYSQTFSASGGVSPYTFSMSGSVPGLNFATATLSGTFTTAGSYPVTITATDSTNGTPLTAEQVINFTVNKRIISGTASATPSSTTLGVPVKISVDLTDSQFSTGPSGSITFQASAGTSVSCSAPIDASSHIASCYLFFTQTGTYSFSATYSGDGNYSTSIANLTLPAALTVSAASLTPQISSGRFHSCYLAANGDMDCWGLSDNFPDGTLTGISSVSSANYGTCAISFDGSVDCWSESPNLNVAQSGKYLSVSVYDSYACAINDQNALHCWGDLPASFTVPSTKASNVAAGHDFACAISAADQSIFCWGASLTAPSGAYKAISAGENHICGIKTNGSLACSGTASVIDTAVLTPPAGTTYTHIGSGMDYSCAKNSSNRLTCWGATQNIPVDTVASYTGMGVGYTHTCALYNDGGENTIACWGVNTNDRAPRLSFSPTSLTQYIPLNKAYTALFTPAGSADANNYSFSVSSGTLPTGLNLTYDAENQTHQIIGTPTVVQSQVFSVKLSESAVSSILPLRLKPATIGYTLTAQSPITTTTVTNATPTTVTAGQGVTITASVADSGTPTLTGTVTIYGKNSSLEVEDQCSTEVASGTASCTLYFGGAGIKTFSASYSGDDFYTTSNSADAFIVNVTPAIITPQVTTGSDYTCSIDDNGRPTCWGNADSNRTTPPANTYLSNIEASSTHVCGRSLSGRVICWGWDGYGVLSVPSTNNFTLTASGTEHSCALTQTGAIQCWGRNDSRISAPTSSTYSNLTAGETFTCALNATGAPVCWGINAPAVPADFISRGTGVALSAGSSFACALHAGGALECWGGNSSITTVPSGNYTAINAGADHACAIRATDNNLVCWGGTNTYGETTAPSGTYNSIAAGGNHSCAINSAGFLVCWGKNTSGQAPVINIAPASIATLDFGAAWTQDLSTTGGRDSSYTYVLSSGSLPTGTSLNNSNGRLSGTLTGAGIFTPQITVTESSFVPALKQTRGYNITVRTNTAFTFTPDQAAYMSGDPVTVEISLNDPAGAGVMGSAPTGQVTVTAPEDQTCTQTLNAQGKITCTFFFTTSGNKALSATYPGDGLYKPGSSVSTVIPVSVFATANKMITGKNHTYLQQSDGTLSCFGNGCPVTVPAAKKKIAVSDTWDCALGLDGNVICKGPAGNATYQPAGKFIDLSAGSAHACGVLIDGSLTCWGSNDQGQSTPPAGSYQKVFSAGNASCALMGSGQITCWGALSTAPVQAGFTDLSLANDHACALAADQSIVCWGDDALGQSTPPSGTFVQTAVGNGFSCALDIDGEINCWGDNSSGQSTGANGVFVQLTAADNHACALRSGNLQTCWGVNDAGEAIQIHYTPLTDFEIPALTYWEHHYDPYGGVKPYTAAMLGSTPAGISMVLSNNEPAAVDETSQSDNETESIGLSPAGLVLFGTAETPGIYPFTLRWQDSTANLPHVLELPQTLTVTGVDLKVSIRSTPADTILVNNRLGFTYSVTNQTALSLPEGNLVIQLPEALSAISVPTLQGCVLNNHSVTCPFSDLSSGSTIDFTIYGTAPAENGAVLTTQAVATPQATDWPEIHPADNQASLTVSTVINQDAISEGFDDPALPAEWSAGSPVTAPSGITYLENNGSTILTLNNLSPHQRVQISFDLYIIGPWTGADTADPAASARWYFGQQGTTALLDASFSNIDGSNQSYPSAYVSGGIRPARSGAAATDELQISEINDSRYHISMTFSHSDSDLILEFGSLNLPADASWGIDSLDVSLRSDQQMLFIPLITR